MTNEEKKRVIIAYLAANAARDFERLTALLTEDFALWMALSARENGRPFPLAGREAYFDFVRALSQRPGMWKVREYQPLHFFFDEADSVAVRLRALGEFPGGFPYDNEYVFIYTLAGDRIREAREFTDVAFVNMLRERAAAKAATA